MSMVHRPRDVTLGDGATYRVFTERGTRAWFVDGLSD